MRHATPTARAVLCGVAVCCSAEFARGQQVAFPGAEGYGKYVTGGRGGTVYEVTTLNATGAGSLGAAIAASGPRTVVFKVAGTITGNFDIKNPGITIAGQTAPGDGICIKGGLGISADNVNVRYLRVRPDTVAAPDTDALGGRYKNNIIIDHVSASWSGDEVLSLYHNTNTTIQWSMISEACAKIIDGVDTGHRFGGIWGNNYGSYHHNLIASNDSRNPRWASGAGFNDYRNNVLYNWGYDSSYGGEAVQPGDTRTPPVEFSTINMIGNYYKPGPATGSGVRDRIAAPSARSTSDKGSWYVSGNVVEGYSAVTADNWKGMDGTNYVKLSQAWAAMAISEQTAADAYNSVLAYAGCSLPGRDTVDKRIVQEVRTGTWTYGDKGIITTPADVGGWPTLATGISAVDSDRDGMPDYWEAAHGLNPNVANNNADFDADGYTDVEEYLNDKGAFPATNTLTFTNAGGTGRFAQSGNWSYAWQPSRFDSVQISTGTAKVDAAGQHAGQMTIGGGTSAATLQVTGGWLDVAQTLNVGGAGSNTQTVTQSGGIVRAGGGVVIGGSGQAGAYNLSGGTLATPLLTKGIKGGAFNFTGGVLHADLVTFGFTNNGGTIAPGSDAMLQLIAAASMPDLNGNVEAILPLVGATRVMGDLTLQSGVLQIDLASKTSFDFVAVDGTLALGGALNLVLASGYSPKLGDEWLIATAGNITGQFASITSGFATRVSGGNLYVVVPEPATLAAFGIGVLALCRRRSREAHSRGNP